MPREESFVLAEVKCPAGCCEFKHKAKDIPLDEVWQWAIGHEIRLYSGNKMTTCTNWFRDDYLLGDFLLWNKDWSCTPAIAYCKERCVPVVLTCRFHTTKNKGFLLHPCRHPTGTMYSNQSSQFTPVTPVPRTLRKAQFSTYGLSFHIAKMQGSFC